MPTGIQPAGSVLITDPVELALARRIQGPLHHRGDHALWQRAYRAGVISRFDDRASTAIELNSGPGCRDRVPAFTAPALRAESPGGVEAAYPS